MATAPSPFPTFPSVTPPPPFCFGAPPYAPYPFPYPNQPPPPSPSYHAAAYHHHHRFQLPPPSHPNPHWHQGMQQMQPPPPTPGNPWHPHHAADQPPPPSSPPPLAASMAAAAPAWPFPSAFVPAVQEGAAPSTSSSRRLPDSPGTTSAPAAALIVLCSGPGPERRPSSPSSAPVPAPSATQARRSTPPTTNTPSASGASTGPAVLGSTTAAPLVGNTTTLPAATTSPTTTPSTEASISKNMPCAILDLKRRLDEQQARDRTSFDKLRGELAKLTSMATQLAISIGKQSSAAESSSTTAYVAQHVFDKMPTPNSGFENCSAHPNQIQSSCVQGGSTNLREKNIEELPQAYGPHNLICRTVVRADGTEHIYYALTEDYSLKQATPLVSPTAAEHVGVKALQFVAAQTAGQVPVCLSKANNTAGSDSPLIPSLQLPMNVQEVSLKQMPVYGLDEEDISCLNCMDKQLDRVFHKASDNAFSEQIRRCFSKVQKTKRTNANVAVYALEQEHNGETTSVNVQQLKDPQLNVLEILERRKEWDPGALLLLMSSRTQHYSPALQSASHATAQERREAAPVYQVSSIQLPMRKLSHVWDPGIESILVFYKWLHIQIIQLVHCPAFLPPMQIAAYCPSNIKQGTQKNYNAKNPLSSPNYLQILELNIIFITFRPP